MLPLYIIQGFMYTIVFARNGLTRKLYSNWFAERKETRGVRAKLLANVHGSDDVDGA